MREFDLAGVVCPAPAITVPPAITPRRARGGVPLHHARHHRPAQAALYRLLQWHAADFSAHNEGTTGSRLPRFVEAEVDAFLKYGIPAHGCLRLRCGKCGRGRSASAGRGGRWPVRAIRKG